MIAVFALEKHTSMPLPEVLAAIAIWFALVSLLDIRKVHFAAEETLKAQKKLMEEVVGRLGSDYVKDAVELYGSGSQVIVTVTKGWGYTLSEDLRRRISRGLTSALEKAPRMKILFSGPIERSKDFPKIMWRWNLLDELRAQHGNPNIKMYHHPALDVVFTVVDDQLLVGWSVEGELLGKAILEPYTAAFFKEVSERMLEKYCPALLWPGPTRNDGQRCLSLRVTDGEERIKTLILECERHPLRLETLLDHLTNSRRDPKQETELGYQDNVRRFLEKQFKATLNGPHLEIQFPAGAGVSASAGATR